MRAARDWSGIRWSPPSWAAGSTWVFSSMSSDISRRLLPSAAR
ncbi:hypothetical protein [Ornithinimicrobium kibberense]